MKERKVKLPFVPQKELGQNFLLDKGYLQKIVNSFPINSQTIIIEIGSGYGHLTNFLANTDCQQVISLEKDPNLFVWLENNWNSLNKEKVFFLHQDALKVDWINLWEKYIKNKNVSAIIVGNLPYSIASPLILNLLTNYQLFPDLVFLIQKEVAQRWAANPQKYKKEYSALSVYLSVFAEVEIILTVPRQYFSPSPLVDGSLVHLKMRKELLLEKEELTRFFAFLQNCFRHRRKTLENNLLLASFKEEKIKKVFRELNYQLLIRSQNLSTQEFIQLYKLFLLHHFPNDKENVFRN